MTTLPPNPNPKPVVRRHTPPEEHSRRIKAIVADLNAAIHDAALEDIGISVETRSTDMGDMMSQRLDVRVWKRL